MIMKKIYIQLEQQQLKINFKRMFLKLFIAFSLLVSCFISLIVQLQNIKVWMLTGDKLETAENIAYSCRLFTGEMSILRLSEIDEEKVAQRMKINYEIYEECILYKRKMAFIIEGDSLTIILHIPHLKTIFLEITSKCAAVVCCRVVPKQKADMVRLIKKSTGKIALAIGDGANDVNMIQEANIGVGIYGNEGMRAVQTSDYAIGEFQGLYRLIFIHGRWCYIRIAEMIIYFLYKNMLFTLPAFYFAFLCAYSASTIYDDWYWSFYNMIFTALPLVIKAVFEQDFNYKMPLRYIKGRYNKIEDKDIIQRSYYKLTMKLMPILYYIGQSNLIFKNWKLLGNLISGVIQGLIIFLFGLFALRLSNIIDDEGHNSDMWYLSITIYTAIIVVVNTKLAITQRYWIWVSFLGLFIGSFGIYILFQFIYNMLLSENRASYTIKMLYSTSYYYLIIAICWGTFIIYESIIIYIDKIIRLDKAYILRILLLKDIKKYLNIVKDLCQKLENTFQENYENSNGEPNKNVENVNNVDNQQINGIKAQYDKNENVDIFNTIKSDHIVSIGLESNNFQKYYNYNVETNDPKINGKFDLKNGQNTNQKNHTISTYNKTVDLEMKSMNTIDLD